MKSKIIILGKQKYEKNNEPNTRLEFVIAEIQESEKFVGMTPINSYFKGHKVFENIKKEMLGKPLDCEFNEITDYYDPLKTRKILKSITYNGNVIDLL